MTRNKWYPEEIMIDKDYTDDLGLLVNTPAKTESLLHSLEQTAGSIGFYVKTNKTEFTCFKQDRIIYKPLELVD